MSNTETSWKELLANLNQDYNEYWKTENKKRYSASDIKDILNFIEDEITKDPQQNLNAIKAVNALGRLYAHDKTMDKENSIQCGALMCYLLSEDNSLVLESGIKDKINSQHFIENLCFGKTVTYSELNKKIDQIRQNITEKRNNIHRYNFSRSLEGRLERSFEECLKKNSTDIDAYDMLYQQLYDLGSHRISELTENRLLQQMVQHGEQTADQYHDEQFSALAGQILKHSSVKGLSDKEIEACAALIPSLNTREHYIMDALTGKALRDIDVIPGKALKQQLTKGYAAVLTAAPEDSDVHYYLSNMCRHNQFQNQEISPKYARFLLTSLTDAMVVAAQQKPEYADFVTKEFKANLPQVIGDTLAYKYDENSFSTGVSVLSVIEETTNKEDGKDYLRKLSAELRKNKGAANKKGSYQRDLVAEHMMYTAARLVENHPDCAQSAMVLLNEFVNMETDQKQMHSILLNAAKILSNAIVKAQPELNNDCSLALEMFLQKHPAVNSNKKHEIHEAFHNSYLSAKKAEMKARLEAAKQDKGKLSGTVIASKIADGIVGGVIDSPQNPEDGNKLANQIQQRLMARKKQR